MNGFSDYRVFDNSGTADARNFGDSRPSVVGTLVHTTSGTDSLYWLTRGSAASGNPASCDYLIERDGTRHRITPRGKYPYHAGKSSWTYNGATYVGDQVSARLLGVELENRDSEYCTDAQLDSLAELIVLEGIDRGWRWPYYVLGHYEVARPMGRRSDPQGFLWGNFMGRLYARAVAANVPGLA